ncbi:MAG: fumarate hydratase [Dehalococcoidia bacterium]|nr:fumarate hydratase [Dehalococcoidia bacterium]MDW8120169.1 fumarate hydratase [Chloroflexota bacterium]
MTVRTDAIPHEAVYQAAYEVNRRAAIVVPKDGLVAYQRALQRETKPLAKFILAQILQNYHLAIAEGRAMCADTGLPRYYVKIGNEARVQGGFVALERALRQAVADVTRAVPLRANRVHPLTRANPGTNAGVFAPDVEYSFEPDAHWIDITAVHKGGLFNTDYRMLFPGDGIEGIKRFFLDNLAEFARRGLSCPPVTVGIGIGGNPDQALRLAQEAACLRVQGDRHPDPAVARLEEELTELGNRTGFGVMGVGGDVTVLDVHVEIAYTHTGGTPVGITQFCHAYRRATARLYPDGRIEYRDDPQWFTPYYRREGIG